jgi:hypothetical protein
MNACTPVLDREAEVEGLGESFVRLAALGRFVLIHHLEHAVSNFGLFLVNDVFTLLIPDQLKAEHGKSY